MSRKSAKWRQCPAAGREITSADCGEHRGSRYACPADCPHNPLAPDNYSQLLAIEDLLDPKCMNRLKAEAGDAAVFDNDLRQALRDRSLQGVHALYVWRLFFQRDEAGLTCAQRFESDGSPGLKNDERVLLRAKMQVRVALIEIHCVRDRECVEVVDLLSPERRPILLRDRSLASMAVRFAACLTWIYPLPYFWRLSGTATMIPDWGPFEPEEIVMETVRHLGGPTEEAEMRVWLAENFVRCDHALSAIAHARRRQMFTGLDARFGKAVYELQAPFAECRDWLAVLPAVAPDDLTAEEHDEGFVEADVWFDDEPQASLGLSGGGRPVLGRVLLGQSHWRLEAIGAERLARLRHLFEGRLGGRVRFAGERQDNLGAKLASGGPEIDESLVPPRLMEEPDRILFTSSRVPAPPAHLSPEEAQAEFTTAQDRAFLDDHIPALDGRTPRQAARDPILRPRLLRLLKHRVRAADERNLRTGRTDDVNWLLQELGASEILFDPPPWRPALPQTDVEDEEVLANEYDEHMFAHLPPPPRLPVEPLTDQEASRRLTAAMENFDTAEEAIREVAASGATILEDALGLSNDLMDEKASAFAVTFLLQAWFALVPRGCRAPKVEPEALAAAFDREHDKLFQAAQSNSPEALMRYLDDSPQPALVRMLALGYMEAERQTRKEMRPSFESQPMTLAMLKTVVQELDRSLRP